MWKRLHVKYLLFLSDFNETLNFVDRFWKTQISNFINIRPLTVVFPCGRTDMTKLIFAFRNFANASVKYSTVYLSFETCAISAVETRLCYSNCLVSASSACWLSSFSRDVCLAVGHAVGSLTEALHSICIRNNTTQCCIASSAQTQSKSFVNTNSFSFYRTDPYRQWYVQTTFNR